MFDELLVPDKQPVVRSTPFSNKVHAGPTTIRTLALQKLPPPPCCQCALRDSFTAAASAAEQPSSGFTMWIPAGDIEAGQAAPVL